MDLLDAPGVEEHTLREGGLPAVNVRRDAEIPWGRLAETQPLARVVKSCTQRLGRYRLLLSMPPCAFRDFGCACSAGSGARGGY